MYIFLSLFLFKFIQMQKIKNKIKTRCPKKEYDAIFEHFYQNIKAYRTCKKICIDQWLGKYFCLLAGIQAKWGLGEQTRFDPITVEESGGNPVLGKFCKFYSHLILGPLFSGIKLTKNCYINVNISFSEKLASPLSHTSIPCLKECPQNFTKYESMGNSKIPVFRILYWRLILQKQTIFLSFSSVRKNWEVQLEQNSNTQKSLCESGKTWKSWNFTAKSNT